MHDMHHMPENDHEAAMARADLYKLAQYSAKLFKMIQEGQQLEGWVQAKITKSADYIASVYHFMAYEMKVSEYGEALENAEVYENDLRGQLQQRLVEAKEKVKALKKVDAMKHKRHKTDKELEEMRQLANEEKSSTGGEIDRSKQGVTKHKQNPNRFSDEPHTEPASKAKSQSAAEKEKNKAADKAEEKEGKNYEKRFGKGSVTRVKDGKKVSEGGLPMTTVNGKKVPAFAADGKGKNDLGKGKAAPTKGAAPKKGVNPFAKKESVAEGYYDLNDEGMQPIDLSSNPSFKEIVNRYTQLVYQSHEGEISDEEDREYNDIEQYVARRFGEKGSAHLQKAGETSFFGRDDGRGAGGSKSSNLGRASQPGGDFRTTRAGKMHGQDAKVMKSRVGDRLGKHPAPNLPEQLKGGQKKLDTDNDQDIDAKDLAALRAKKKDRIKEAVAAKCNESTKSKSCPVHGMKDCSAASKANSR